MTYVPFMETKDTVPESYCRAVKSILISRRTVQRKILRIMRRPWPYPHLFFCERVSRNFTKFGVIVLYSRFRASTNFARIGLVTDIYYIGA